MPLPVRQYQCRCANADATKKDDWFLVCGHNDGHGHLIAKPSIMVGGLLMVASSVCIAIDTAVVRVVVNDVHPLEVTFFRTFFSLLFMLPYLWRAGIGRFATHHLGFHFLRAVCKLVAVTAFFFAVSMMPLAEVTAVVFAMPLFAAIGAWLFLREAMRTQRVVATLIGFIGVLIIVQPGAGVFGLGAILAMVAAFGMASISLAAKYLSRTEKAPIIVFWNLVLMTPLAGLTAIPFWRWPDGATLALLAVQGVLAMSSMLCTAASMRHGDASTLIPLDFLRLPLVAAIGFVAFAEVPAIWTWIGACVIFAATMLLLREGRASQSGPTLPV
jgi:drug/metabolite transporter (DMT)-like permease